MGIFKFSVCRSVIERVCTFVGVTLSEEKVCELVSHLGLESMRENRAVNREQSKAEI